MFDIIAEYVRSIEMIQVSDIISDDADNWYVVLSMFPIRLVNTADHSISIRDGLTGFTRIGSMSGPERLQFEAMIGAES